MGLGGVCLGGLLVGLGLKLVSATAAKPWVGCWLLGSRTTLLVAPGTSAGRAGLSCAWAGRWMGKACLIHTQTAPKGLGLLDDLGPDTSMRLVVGRWPEASLRHVRQT